MRPILLDYAKERTGDDTPVFRYDRQLSLNVIDTKSGKIPFVEVDTTAMEMVTKTRIDRESDDDHSYVLELATKTKIQRESEDDFSCLIELATKTLVKRERDDENITHN